MKDRLFFIPHTHYDAVVFKMRAEYLEMGLPIILHALQCLRDDPHYRFVLDQTCYIRPFLERYPEEVATFRAMVAEGRLQITCGMDSMADVNMPSGESFVRQVLYGKGYARAKLGVEVNVGWALDTFGHHPQMPQLLRQAGFSSYFFFRGVPSTRTPSEFYWQGIDGSQVLCFWLPYGYGCLADSPQNLAEFTAFMRSRYEALKPHATTSCIPGLSGGDLSAPEPHVSVLAEALNRNDSVPFELVVATPDEFLQAFQEAAAAREDPLSVLACDMNPIFQGCYSSRIEVKQWNRELERLLTSVEKLDAMAASLGLKVDGETLGRAWEPVLFNQFHDCMGGVQVDKVFEDTMQSYHFSARLANELLESRLAEIADQIDTTGAGIPLIVYNTLGWARSDMAQVEVGFTQTGVLDLGLFDSAGQPMPVQVLEAERYAGGGYRRAKIMFVARDVPPMGYAVYHLVPNAGQTFAPQVSAGGGKLWISGLAAVLQQPKERGAIANEHFQIELDLGTGAILSLRAKADGWEALRGDMGNVVARERDGGDFWQLNGALDGAENIQLSRPQPPPVPGRAELSCDQVGNGQVRQGPVMAEFSVSHPFGKGWFSTRVRLYAGLRRIDIHTELLNNEPAVRYRVLFPTPITSGKITHEIPFGAIERPALELPAQNWVDYGDGEHGLALLNRGLPGHNVDDGVMMLSLMRGAEIVSYSYAGGYEMGVTSSSGQEIGKRLAFDYALVPHKGSWQEARAYRAGLEFNNPLLTRKAAPHAGEMPARWSLLRVSPENVVVSAVKLSADGWTVVRLYEAEGQAVSHVEVELGPEIEAAQEANLLEDALGPLAVEGNKLRFDLGRFEIKTLRLRLRAHR